MPGREGARTRPRPRRVLGYGVTGSGKSVLAARISGRLGLPWYAVDELAWEPGWVPVPVEVQRERVERICAQEGWVLDTAYSSWVDIPLARADLVVGLDYPRWLSLARLARRSLTRLVRRTEVCNGNRESLRNLCGPDSILLWHFRSFGPKRSRIRQWQRDPDRPDVIVFGYPSDVTGWLRML